MNFMCRLFGTLCPTTHTKMEQAECPETSVRKIQTAGK